MTFEQLKQQLNDNHITTRRELVQVFRSRALIFESAATSRDRSSSWSGHATFKDLDHLTPAMEKINSNHAASERFKKERDVMREAFSIELEPGFVVTPQGVVINIDLVRDIQNSIQNIIFEAGAPELASPHMAEISVDFGTADDLLALSEELAGHVGTV